MKSLPQEGKGKEVRTPARGKSIWKVWRQEVARQSTTGQGTQCAGKCACECVWCMWVVWTCMMCVSGVCVCGVCIWCGVCLMYSMYMFCGLCVGGVCVYVCVWWQQRWKAEARLWAPAAHTGQRQICALEDASSCRGENRLQGARQGPGRG